MKHTTAIVSAACFIGRPVLGAGTHLCKSNPILKVCKKSIDLQLCVLDDGTLEAGEINSELNTIDY